MTHAEFLTEHKQVLEYINSDMNGALIDARRWSAFGMIWESAIQQPWWSDFISDSMNELRKLSELLVGQKMSDFMKYIVQPQLFATRMLEYLNKKVSPVVIPTIIKPSDN
jgi:hypothetical protein